MQAILEEVQEGTAVHERLALVVAGLAEAEAKLGDQRGEEGGPAHFDMYDGDSQCEGWQEEHHSATDGPEGTTRPEATGGEQRNGKPVAEWRPEGPGRWARASASNGGIQQLRPNGPASADGQCLGRDAGDGALGKGRSQDGVDTMGDNGTTEAGKGGAVPGDRDGESGERAGKHRRRRSEEESTEEARIAADARSAEELHRQLQVASAVQEQSYREGGGGFGSEAALSVAAQKFVLDVQKAQAQANEMGVTARAQDGRSLLELSPAELRQWTDEHLDGSGMRD